MRLTLALNQKEHRLLVLLPCAVQQSSHSRGGINRSPLYLDDQIATLQALLGGRAVGSDLLNQDTRNVCIESVVLPAFGIQC